MGRRESKAEELEREAREMRAMAGQHPRASDTGEFWTNQAQIRDRMARRAREREVLDRLAEG